MLGGGRWGTCVAEGLVGKGRGSRALLASLRSGCLLHDASYLCPLALSGPQAALFAALACVRQALATVTGSLVVMAGPPLPPPERRPCHRSSVLVDRLLEKASGLPSGHACMMQQGN